MFPCISQSCSSHVTSGDHRERVVVLGLSLQIPGGHFQYFLLPLPAKQACLWLCFSATLLFPSAILPLRTWLIIKVVFHLYIQLGGIALGSHSLYKSWAGITSETPWNGFLTLWPLSDNRAFFFFLFGCGMQLDVRSQTISG